MKPVARDINHIYLLLQVVHDSRDLPSLKAINASAMAELQEINDDILDANSPPKSVPDKALVEPVERKI